MDEHTPVSLASLSLANKFFITLTLGVKAFKTVFLLLLASKAFESKVGPSQVELIIVPHFGQDLI
jgi:hypothetical protein